MSSATPWQNFVQPGKDEQYKKRIEKRSAAADVHEADGALVPDPVPAWQFQDSARYVNEEDHKKKIKEEKEQREALKELKQEEPEFSIITALQEGRSKENAKKRPTEGPRGKQAGKEAEDDRQPDVTGQQPEKQPQHRQQEGGEEKKGKKKGKAAAKSKEKARRLNDPEEDRRLAEAAGIVYIDQGDTRIDLDTGELVLTKPLVPKPFTYDEIRPDYTVVLFGKRGTGKSYLIRYMLYHMRHIFPFGIVMSRTEEANKFFQQFVPKSYIYDDVYPEVIQKLLDVQRENNANKEIDHPDWRHYLWSFIILDDCADNNLRYNNMLSRYAGRSRCLPRCSGDRSLCRRWA